MTTILVNIFFCSFLSRFYPCRALAIKPENADAIREWSVAALKIGEHAVAYAKICEAARLAPERRKADFYSIMRLVNKDPDDEWKILFPNDVVITTEPVDHLQDIRDFVGTIRERLGNRGQDFLKQKEMAERNEKMFLRPESLLAPERLFFLVLRKWNSYTPAIPSDNDERSRGGGYFIYHNGKGTVIDPGYNSLKTFSTPGAASMTSTPSSSPTPIMITP